MKKFNIYQKSSVMIMVVERLDDDYDDDYDTELVEAETKYAQ